MFHEQSSKSGVEACPADKVQRVECTVQECERTQRQHTVLRNCKDLLEIFGIQILEFNIDRESSLKFRNEVSGLGCVKSSCSDEEDMVCLYRSVLCVDDTSFNYRKNVSLYAFSGNIRAGSVT